MALFGVIKGGVKQLYNVGLSDMTGATSSADGANGLVPAPQAGDEDKVLRGDGTWGTAGDTATVRYNENTDRFEVLLNGTWVQSIKAYADNLILFDGTTFYDSYENGVYIPASNWALLGGFTINLPNFVAPYSASGNACNSFAFSNAIDVTEYSSLIVEASSGTLTVDISNVSQSVYIILYTTYDSAYNTSDKYGCRLDAVLSTVKTNFANGRVTSNKMANMTNSYITSIRLVK